MSAATLGLWCITTGLVIGIPAWAIQARRDAQLRRAVQTQLMRNGYATRTRRARSSRFGA